MSHKGLTNHNTS